MAWCRASLRLLLTLDDGGGAGASALALFLVFERGAFMAKTARKVCEYALRKVFGTGETPSSEHMADAIERLDDMLAFWAATGAPAGITYGLEPSNLLTCPPSYIGPIQDNLIIALADLYDRSIPAQIAYSARVGLQMIKWDNLPEARAMPLEPWQNEAREAVTPSHPHNFSSTGWTFDSTQFTFDEV